MTTSNSDLLEVLEKELFGEDFLEEQQLIDKILSCTTLEEFQALGLDKKSETVESIFANASFTDPDAKIFTAEYLHKLYDELPAVRNNSDFI